MSIGYVFKEGLSGIKRARLASVTSIFSLFIALLLLGVLARLAFNAYEVAQNLKTAIDVEVFLEDLDDRSTERLRNRLEERPMVEGVSYISKDSAAAIFRKEFGAEGETLANLKFLPASFRLSIARKATVADIRSMVEEVKEMRGVEGVRFNQQLLQVLETRIQNLVLIGSAVGFFIILTAIVLVFNTIRLTIYAKRNLIKAMKLVGATNGFIRRPFYVEGVIQGLVAALVAIGAIFLLFQYLIPYYIPQLGILSWPFGRWYYLTGAILVLGLIMGFWGSRMAAHKFIKEATVDS